MNSWTQTKTINVIVLQNNLLSKIYTFTNCDEGHDASEKKFVDLIRSNYEDVNEIPDDSYFDLVVGEGYAVHGNFIFMIRESEEIYES